MAVYTNCSACHNAFPIGRNFDFPSRVCCDCAMKKRAADAQEAAKTALADDLVRGVPSGDQREDSK
jgi:hypothetical protein